MESITLTMPPPALKANSPAQACGHSLLSMPEIPFHNQSLRNGIRQSLFHNIHYTHNAPSGVEGEQSGASLWT